MSYWSLVCRRWRCWKRIKYDRDAKLINYAQITPHQQNSTSDPAFSTWCQLNRPKLSFSTVQLLGKLFFESRRQCLQKHTIAEIMAPSILAASSPTNISNESWRVEEFFDILVRGVRGSLGDLYLPSIFTSENLFIKFVCELRPQLRSYLWKQNSVWSSAASAQVKTEMKST